MAPLRKFLCLKTRDQRLYLKSLLLVSVIRVGLWLLPFNVLRRFLINNIMSKQGISFRQKTSDINRIANAIKSTSRFVPQANCLIQALATQLLLRRCGYEVNLHIGVTKSEKGRLQAHAWVESQGTVIIGQLADLSRFEPMPPLTWR